MTWLWIGYVVIGVGYVVIGVLLLVPFNKVVRTGMGDMSIGSDDPADVFMAWFLAVIGAMLWPVIVVSMIAIFLSRVVWSFFDKPKVHQ